MMAQGTDREYLLNQQYRDASNLNARMQLHQRFSTNKHGWHRWVFDQIHLPPRARVLELGCGPGTLWCENGERLPEGWEITLSDFSAGMVQEAQRNLADIQRNFTFEAVDAQAIPFATARFDTVIANHMLYHVPDRTKAYAEIRRVLKPEGRFYAATNGPAHLRELHDRVRVAALKVYTQAQAEVTADRASPADSWTEAFNLETGQEELSRWFSAVALSRYPDALVVTEAEPLIAYVLSGRYGAVLAGEPIGEFTRSVEEEIVRHGAVRITKDAGLFEAWQQEPPKASPG
jgi:ubiquinone/menaquinone biosynthesis C-methylase UbiE